MIAFLMLGIIALLLFLTISDSIPRALRRK